MEDEAQVYGRPPQVVWVVRSEDQDDVDTIIAVCSTEEQARAIAREPWRVWGEISVTRYTLDVVNPEVERFTRFLPRDPAE